MLMTLRDQGDLCHHRRIEAKGEPHHSRESTFHNQRSVRTMFGSVSYSCVRNCHRTFAMPQNQCTLGTSAFWYEEGISKLVSRYGKCLSVQGDYVEKQLKVCDKTCIFCFFPIINKYLCMAKRSLLSERPSYALYNIRRQVEREERNYLKKKEGC